MRVSFRELKNIPITISLLHEQENILYQLSPPRSPDGKRRAATERHIRLQDHKIRQTPVFKGTIW
jgi:hypothetical protein